MAEKEKKIKNGKKGQRGGRREEGNKHLHGNMKWILNHMELIFHLLVSLGLQASPWGQPLA